MLPKSFPKSWKLSNVEYCMDFDSQLFTSSTKLMTKFGDAHLFTDCCSNLYILDKLGNIYYVGELDVDADPEDELLIKEELFSNLKFNWDNKIFQGFFNSKNLFFNADEDDYNDMSILSDWSGIGISFNCLLGLDPKALDKVQAGRLIVKSFSEKCDPIPLTKSEKSRYNEKKKLTPPGRGYSVIKSLKGYVWHKSEYVLMYDSILKKSYLLGQDEDQYFGVELPTNPKNVDDAVESLKPKEIRNIDCQRQGEWFLVPVDEKNVPSEGDEITVVLESDLIEPLVSVILPRTIDGNKHRLSSCNVRIKDNVVYALDPYLKHDQHETVSSLGWVKFLKNTAVRSVSVDGVD